MNVNCGFATEFARRLPLNHGLGLPPMAIPVFLSVQLADRYFHRGVTAAGTWLKYQ
jgi:hypothetical protein